MTAVFSAALNGHAAVGTAPRYLVTMVIAKEGAYLQVVELLADAAATRMLYLQRWVLRQTWTDAADRCWTPVAFAVDQGRGAVAAVLRAAEAAPLVGRASGRKVALCWPQSIPDCTMYPWILQWIHVMDRPN